MNSIKIFRINILFLMAILMLPLAGISQKKKKNEKKEYDFTIIKEVKTTSVKDQHYSGTCWSFAAVSFLETELLRMGKDELNISEMYFVKNAYSIKARNYVRLHGNAVFTQGGQAHDVINLINDFGIVTEEAYPGLNYGEKNHIHDEMEAVLKSMVDAVIKNKNKRLSTKWFESINAVIEIYLGKNPESFDYNGKSYSPQSFVQEIATINPDDYIELTSYSHHSFYEKFNLEIPDNWSNSLYYNLPIDELMEVIENAFNTGYSVCWDGDISEKTFSHKKGVAIIPEKDWEDMTKDEKDNIWDGNVTEKNITQECRQKTFDNYTTIDDHLMHLVGIAQDQNGNKYFKTKNSWTEDSNDYGGYLFMSDNYISLKTIAIMIHKDALPENIREKLDID
ncbi:MAG: aminopeptidase [Bacteroidales bacterium]|nr:aminopeptidase [Bacteroidales bacterium]